MVKLCIGCQHYGATQFGMSDYCKRAETLRDADLVRGEQTLTYCEISRRNDEMCGPAGKYWEAK